ncbi:MAG: Lipid flippase MurJ [Gaiellaceae bacterium]|nr:Lipid flippase MurJ [Gaiellaceae bacterium]
MIRATAGVWINYSTTLVFQVLFASRFGTSVAATVFATCFAIAIALATIVLATSQSIVLPRLLTEDGELVSGAVAMMSKLLGFSVLLIGVLAFLSGPLARGMAPRVDFTAPELTTIFRAAALFAVGQIAVVQLITVAVARGRRFAAAAAPSFPSVAGAALLLTDRSPSLTSVFLALAGGTLIEFAFLAVVSASGARLVRAPMDRVSRITALTLVQFSLLALLLPYETVLASWNSPHGGAIYGYAIRSLVVAQQLIVGGVVLTSLGQWSALARRAQQFELVNSIKLRLALGLVVVSLAGAIALAAGHTLVAAVYQRGSFGVADTRAVTIVLYAALIGFGAEAMSMVLSQAFVAERRNGAALIFGFARVGGRAGLALALAPFYGAKGVAVAYSITSAAVVAAQLLLIARSNTWRSYRHAFLRKSVLAAAATLAAGITVSWWRGEIPTTERIGVVILVFGAASASLVKSARLGMPRIAGDA